jgi:hypothetical protein
MSKLSKEELEEIQKEIEEYRKTGKPSAPKDIDFNKSGSPKKKPKKK